MNPVSGFSLFTSRRRKFEEMEDTDSHSGLCKKSAKTDITIAEKELNADVAAHGQFVDMEISEEQHSSVGQLYQSTYPDLVYHGGQPVSQTTMDFSAVPAQPNWMGQEDRSSVACAGSVGESRAPMSAQEVVIIQEAPSPFTSKGLCLQCLNGESGHYRHIHTNNYTPGMQQ